MFLCCEPRLWTVSRCLQSLTECKFPTPHGSCWKQWLKRATSEPKLVNSPQLQVGWLRGNVTACPYERWVVRSTCSCCPVSMSKTLESKVVFKERALAPSITPNIVDALLQVVRLRFARRQSTLEGLYTPHCLKLCAWDRGHLLWHRARSIGNGKCLAGTNQKYANRKVMFQCF